MCSSIHSKIISFTHIIDFFTIFGYIQIVELEKRLQNQFDVRGALEKALGYKTPSRGINTKGDSTQKVDYQFLK